MIINFKLCIQFYFFLLIIFLLRVFFLVGEVDISAGVNRWALKTLGFFLWFTVSRIVDILVVLMGE